MASIRVKESIVGTALGRALARGRDLLGLWLAAARFPERLGSMSQEVIARQLLVRMCEPGRAFVDVGAHIGSVIAEVHHHQPGLPLIAIEADPAKAQRLQERFPFAAVHHCAAGDTAGRVSFFVDTLRPGYSSLAKAGRQARDLEEVEVPMRLLDELVEPTIDVGMIKLDVEGAELAVLRGAEALFSRSRPVVQFESGLDSGTALGLPIEDLFEWFAAREYDVLVPSRVAHNGPALNLEGFVEAHHYPRRTLNYYGVPSERRLEVRDRARRSLGARSAS